MAEKTSNSEGEILHLGSTGRIVKINKNYKNHTIPMRSVSEEVDNALAMVEAERSGKQLGLFCRWDKINRAVNKYFRFGNFNLLAGLSSAGKSYFLNMLLQDFSDKELLNKQFEKEVIFLHFGYEMSPVKELLREASGKLKQSYNYLISSQYQDDKEAYNVITDKEYDSIKRVLDQKRGVPLYFAKDTGSLTNMYYTAYEYVNKFPNAKIVITNDHTLLNRRTSQDGSEIELIANAAKTFIKIRDDFDAMIIAIGQLNGNIQDINRRLNKNLHYPVSTDIHGSNQMFQALDDCFIIHRPELLNIPYYGDEGLNTRHLVHMAYLKSRNGDPANIWFKENLSKGIVEQASKEDFNQIDLTGSL